MNQQTSTMLLYSVQRLSNRRWTNSTLMQVLKRYQWLDNILSAPSNWAAHLALEIVPMFSHISLQLCRTVGNKRGVRDRLGVIAGVWWYLYQYPLIETLSSVYSKLFPLSPRHAMLQLTLTLVHFTLGSDSGKRPTWDILRALCRLFVSERLSVQYMKWRGRKTFCNLLKSLTLKNDVWILLIKLNFKWQFNLNSNFCSCSICINLWFNSIGWSSYSTFWAVSTW